MKTTVISIEEALKNSNSTENQHIKRQFVDREVYCNVGQLVEYILNKSMDDDNFNGSDAPFSYDDIENYYSYPEYYGKYANFTGGTEEMRDEEVDELERLLDSEDGSFTEEETKDYEKISEINEEIEELKNLESEPQDIYEYWAISSYLYDKLKELGEPVINTGAMYIWGRTYTGQAILLDYSISKICADMEILEGQSNSWAK